MKWLSFFQETENISADETRDLLDTAPTGSCQLLDVRQPGEYSQDHIPGALLIPLKELPERTGELSPELKTIVYCRSGVRSKSGCQILKDHGFTNVLNMKGGILSWNGHKASGDPALGLDYFLPGEFESAVSMAFSMEAGLQKFYQHLADTSRDQECQKLLDFMARLEDGHMAKLAARHPDLELDANQSSPAAAGEGGIDMRDFQNRYGSQIDTVEKILQTAMMFESQAYDLYSRLSRKEDDPALQSFFISMAEEEKSHLERLTKEFEGRII